MHHHVSCYSTSSLSLRSFNFLDGQRISKLTSVVARAKVVSDFETSNFKADRRLTKKLKLSISAAAMVVLVLVPHQMEQRRIEGQGRCTLNSKHIIFHPATTATDCAGAGAGPSSNRVPTGLTLVLDGGRVIEETWNILRVILTAE